FPAGLLVYWITTNVWTIVQQAIVRKRLGPMRPEGQEQESLSDMIRKLRSGDDDDGDGKGPKGTKSPKASATPAIAGSEPKGRPSGPPPAPPRRKKKRSGRRR
ncbi:MAG TPA: hypothetical protein VFN44_20410, partial [Solirubrobacteraceae bacterium]|nr:hypothetical protein [Solirubrobacteraceae bacterium]